MIFKTNMFIKSVLIICLLSNFQLVGQIIKFKNQDQFVWQNDSLARVPYPASGSVTFESRTGKGITKVKLPEGHPILGAHAWENKIYCLLGDEDIVPPRIIVVVHEQILGWTQLGIIDTSGNHGAVPSMLLPFGEDGRYLAYTSAQGFVDGDQASPVAIYRLKESSFSFERLIPLEFDGEPIQIVVKTDNWKHGELNPRLAATDKFLPFPIRFDGGVGIISMRAGLVWIIRDDKTSVSRVVNIYGVQKDDLSVKARNESAVLAVQPTKEGHITFALRDEAAFRHAHEFFDSVKNDVKDKDGKLIEQKKLLETFSDLVWRELDPITGEIEKIYPDNAPTHLRDLQTFRKFKFRYKIDGSIICFED